MTRADRCFNHASLSIGGAVVRVSRRLPHRQQIAAPRAVTLSARTIKECGKVMPLAMAVFWLRTSSYLVGGLSVRSIAGARQNLRFREHHSVPFFRTL
jgi:hypothetical protein